MIIGMKRDPQFGPLLMFGLAGIYVEILRDVSFRLAPIKELGALHMIESTKASKLLGGVRGEKRSDIRSIVEYLERMSQLVMDFSEIQEIVINNPTPPYIEIPTGMPAPPVPPVPPVPPAPPVVLPACP